MANFGYFWPYFLIKNTLFHPVYPNKPHGPPKMISLIQLLNGGPKLRSRSFYTKEVKNDPN